MDKDKKGSTPSGKLQEGVDFYLENGLFVFTAKFLSERGYCCRSGCRHCPYGFNGDLATANELGPATPEAP